MKKAFKSGNTKKVKFSISLGLVDYINPILYGITTITIIKNMKYIILQPWFNLFVIGAIISLLFGLIIPTGKLLVGFGIIKFKMPVSLVFLVNTGILISGIALFKTILNINVLLLILITIGIIFIITFILYKAKNFNTIAVLTGTIGYLLIYASLITMTFRKNLFIPLILYATAISLFIFLCMIGIKANLKDARVHWVIEISNILCQLSVATGTILLFKL